MKAFAKNRTQGTAHSSSHDSGSGPFFGVQAKLSVGKPGDKYEVEADSVADKVVAKTEHNASSVGGTESFFPSKPSPVQKVASEEIQSKEETEEIQEKPLAETITPVVQLASDDDEAIQEKCTACESEEKKQVQKMPFEDVQQKSEQKGSHPSPNFESQLSHSKGRGAPLHPTTKNEMESGFGTDFSGVRVHTDSQAVQMNQQLGSQAFTNGNDIYFNEGKYSPDNASGKHLLAHELTHTIQQGSISSATNIARMPLLSTKSFKGDYNLNIGKRPTIQAFGLDDIGGALSAGADFISDTAGSAVDFAGDVVEGALELGADAIMAIVRRISPSLAEIIENGPLDMIAEALNGGIQSWLAGIFGELGISEFIGGLRESFEGIFAMLQGVMAGDAASCEAFNQAIQSIRDFISDFMNNPFFEAIRSVFDQVSSFLSEMFDLLVAPVLDAVIGLVGDAFSVVTDIASTIWGWISAVKDFMLDAWTWVMESLGISGDGEGGVWEWIKGFASDIWEEIKSTFEPIIGPLRVILTILVVISPVGPLVIALTYGPRIVEAVQWLWANKDNPNIVADAREQMGDGILPQLLEAGQGFIGAITGAVDSMLAQFVELGSALLDFLGAVTGVPLLDMARSFVETVSQGVQDFIAWGQTTLTSVIEFFSGVFEKIRTTVAPYMEILTSIGMAILNPSMIPIMLMGWAWRALPDCFKPPIIDFLLDGIIGYLEALPNLIIMGPLWPLLKPFIIGFLQGFRNADDAQKIAVTNKLAKIISGASIEFIIGFVVGFLRGIWEGLTDPFVLIYQILSGLSSLTQWFAGIIMGDSEETPAAESSATATGSASTGSGTASSSATASTTAPSEATPSAAAGSGATPIPPAERQALTARMSEMGGELAEPAGQVTGNFMEAASEYFQGGEMTFESLAEKLGDMWSSAEEAIRGAGSSLAEQFITFLTGDGAEREIGDSVGWVAGSIVFEVVLGILTAGTYAPVSAVGKALKFFAKVLDWTGEALGLAFKMLGKLGKALMKLFDKLVEMASRATGALRIVIDALKEIGEKVIRFADELFGRFGRGAGGEVAEEGAERAAREATEEASERAAREGIEETAEEASERAAREGLEETGEEAAERGAREGADDALKAAEMPAALAAARSLTEANDLAGVSAMVTVAALNATIKPRFRWIEYFEAEPKGGLGVYEINMIASKTTVDSRYTDENPIDSPTSRQRAFESEVQKIDGLTPEELAELRRYNVEVPNNTRSPQEVLDDIRNDRRVWNEDTRRYNTLPEVPDGVPRADLPPDGSPQAVAWDDYVNGNSPVPCFPEGTLISTPNGKKPIETIAVNDMVWSFDHLAKKTRIGYVKGISKNHTLSLVHIHSKGHVLKATRNHPFWIEEEEKYYRADALTEGMFLRKMDGQLVKIDSIYIEEIETITYNFEVSNYRNYFVGEDEVLVHNDDVVEAVASGLANTDTFPSRIYIIADPVTNQVIYVGQTIQTLDTRFGQHLTDPNSSIFQYLRDNGYPQLADNPDFLRGRNLDDLFTIETPINGNMMTHYELTVWEQFYIDNNGGIANLENKINAITPEKRLQYASFHNPCY